MKTLFNDRCETLLVTMVSGKFQSITSKQVMQWLDINESAVGPFMQKVCSFNILKKVGAARNTTYELTEGCNNSLVSQMKTKDVIQAVKYVVNWQIKHPKTKVQKLTTEAGKQFLKVQSTEELDESANNAINQLMSLINQNKDLRAEVALLREEVERLKVYEEKYNQIKSI